MVLTRTTADLPCPTPTGRGTGYSRTYHGYCRFTRGELRDRLVHRRTIEVFIQEQRRIGVAMLIGSDPEYREWFESWLRDRESNEGRLSISTEVHHQDFDKTHNCGTNLIAMQDVLHERTQANYLPKDRWMRYKSKSKKASKR